MSERDHIAGLPVFVADPAAPGPAFEPGAPFWRAIESLAQSDRLYGQLDDLLAGATSPRVWLVAHEPTRGELSATAALMLARALLSRGQAVVVVDVDEAGSALTIWAEREETEGWIDVARFGASVTAASVALPFRGGRGELLGVGSFSPTDAGDDEIAALLGRLRHHADDIVLVGVTGPELLPWAKRAQRRLLCWDRAARPADRLAPVLGPFASAGAPITALLAYGTAAAEPAVQAAAGPEAERAAADEMAEQIAAAVPAVAAAQAGAAVEDDVTGGEAAASYGEPDAEEPAAAGPPEAAPIAAAEPADALPEPGAAAAESVAEESAAEESAAAESAAEESAAATVGAAPGDHARGPIFDDDAEVDQLIEERFRGAPDSDLGTDPGASCATPRLFWIAAAAFAVALIAVAWYWTARVRVPRGGFFEPVVTQSGGGVDGADVLTDSTGALDVASGSPADSTGAPAGTGEQAAPRQVAQAGGLTSIGDTLPGTGTATGGGASATAPTSAPTRLAGGEPAAAVTFDPAAYAVPAGQAGWALHVYSQADSASAAKQSAQLERAGYRVAVRIVDIKDKGRWWRLYLGSFPSRAAARAAMPSLLARLGASWAEPARIQD